MKLANLIATGTALAATATAGVVPTTSPDPSVHALRGLTLLASNITSIDEAPALVKRQGHDYNIFFFTARECGGNIISIWGGSGTTACTSVGGDARSMGWLPYDSGRSIRVSSSGNCGNQANVFGPGDSGCRGFTANVAQGGVETFQII